MLDVAQQQLAENPATAFELAKHVHDGAVELQDGSGQARSLRIMASARFYQSEFLESQTLAEQALTAAQQAQDALMEVEALNSLGAISYRLGDFGAAMEWRLLHLELVTSQHNQSGLFHALNNLGNLYGELDELENAYAKHHAAARLAEELQDGALQAIATTNVGEDLTHLGRHDEAHLVNQQAVELSRSADNPIALGAALANLACSLNALGDFQGAQAAAREAVAIAERLRDRVGHSYALEVLGRALLGLHDDGALPLLEHSLRLLEGTDARGRQKDAHDALAAAYEALGDPARALPHLQASHRLERTLHSQQVDQKIKAVTARLELQRLQDEAAHERQARQALSELNQELALTVQKLELANQALEKLTEQLWQQANTDTLTGLLNRSAFIQVLEQKIRLWEGSERPFFVVFLDLDDFKSVNDRFGHDVGDRLLVTVGERIQQAVPPATTIARLSGDEFMMLLEASDEVQCVDTVLKALNQSVEILGHPIRISASAGLSAYPSSGRDVNSLMIQADHAMYQAKHLGKGQVQRAVTSVSESNTSEE
ncbi:diguanylate cyclase domain-containing protein [Deinococcus oregonensis]|uniref:Diguanylate cyclase domain-containing protein n=1 Tax=Deinococcus oregonensis TaxID=1805970 RepID=A0ABV6B0S6_9DEIO